MSCLASSVMLGKLLLLKRDSFTYSAQGRGRGERSRLETAKRAEPFLVRLERRRSMVGDEDESVSLFDSNGTESDVEIGKNPSNSSKGRAMLGKVLEGCNSLGCVSETRRFLTRIDEGSDMLDTLDFSRGLAA